MGSKEYIFIETLRDNFLSQLVSDPTRFRGNDEPSTIDLVITNDENRVSILQQYPGLGRSDHVIIDLLVEGAPPSQERDRMFVDYNRGNFTRLRNLLNIDWEGELEARSSLEEKWKLFREKYEEAVKRAIPVKKYRKFKTALSPKMRKKIKEKNQLHQEVRRTGNEQVRLRYRRISNQVRRLTREAKKQRQRKIADDVKDNPKRFWREVNTNTKYKPSISDLQTAEGLTESNTEKAAVLSDYFSEVFTDEPIGPLNKIPSFCNCQMREIDITSSKVATELRKLDTNKSPGPDSVHPRILKESSDIISQPLSIIFRESMNTSHLPEDWKTAHVTAIFKKGNKSLPENYRPVSLTSVVCKTMERLVLVRREMMSHMRTNRLFSDQQYGFIDGRSTTLQLLNVLDDWTATLDQGGTVDVAYCDFRKAFDKVPHRRLL